jgi:23S rRNA pseudouridine1911/1915/1917 synthase
MPNPQPSFTFRVSACQTGRRLDALVASEIDHLSRSFAAKLIRQGCIRVDGTTRKPGYLTKAGQWVRGEIHLPEVPSFQPEAIPLDILYEDEALLVVNKAPGMVVHPAPGHSSGTLANALMHHCPDLAGISGSLRPGIVHRLDKDTSGALAVAKNSRAMHHLADQFKSRRVSKHYLALVYGLPASKAGRIDRPIGRHPMDRKRMSVNTRTPRPALTRWRVCERFAGVCMLDLDIRTGRTHQIRVHCLSMGHPVIGDPVYSSRGARNRLAAVCGQTASATQGVDRQMLHAARLGFTHPDSGEAVIVQAPMFPDMTDLIDRFRRIAADGIRASQRPSI